MRKCAVSLLVALGFAASAPYAAAPTGWTTYAAGNNVYKASVGGSPQAVASSADAKHACWSRDGSMIFYITNGGDIYAMDNQGGGRKKIGTGDAGGFNKINAYRPEPKSVLCVSGTKFCKIDASVANPVRVEIATSNVSIDGEIAINTSGDRIAFRSGDGNGGRLKKMVVGQNASGYANYCSANISPNGSYLLENQDGHTSLKIYNWSGGSSSVNVGTIGHWDNQSFAVNSDDWIVAMDDDPTTNDNVGNGIGVVSRSNEAYMVTSWSGSTVMYPSFFVGDLPTGPTAVAYEAPITNQTAGIRCNSRTGSIAVTFSLPGSQYVRLSVFDMAGKLISRSVAGSFPQGTHSIYWDGRDSAGRLVRQGAYSVVLEKNNGHRSWKVLME